MYLVLWRWQHGDKQLLSGGDVHGARLQAMVAAVRRAEHEMHHCIRFHERRRTAGPPRFVAWFEPRHDVLPLVAKHFTRRMARVTWMIASPGASVLWDGASLHSTGALIHDGIEGAAAMAQSLGHFRDVFNPARQGAELRLR
jgi:DNA polymerase